VGATAPIEAIGRAVLSSRVPSDRFPPPSSGDTPDGSQTVVPHPMSMGGTRITRVLDLDTPADMGYDSRRHRLLVPSLFGNGLLIHPLD
jgi:hypothetical protein